MCEPREVCFQMLKIEKSHARENHKTWRTLQFIPFRRSFRRAFVTFALRAFRTALRLVFVDFARFGFLVASSIVTVCSTAAFFSKSIESWSTASIGFPAPFFLTPALTLTFFLGMKPRFAFVLTMAAKGASNRPPHARACTCATSDPSPAKQQVNFFRYCDVHDLIAKGLLRLLSHAQPIRCPLLSRGGTVRRGMLLDAPSAF